MNAAFVTPPLLPFRADRLDVCNWVYEMPRITYAAAHFVWAALGCAGLRDAIGCNLFSPWQLTDARVPRAWLHGEPRSARAGDMLHHIRQLEMAHVMRTPDEEEDRPHIRGMILR